MTSIEQIVDRQLRKWELEKQRREQEPRAASEPLPIVTVSRMRGSRGSYLAKRLAEELQYQLIHREMIDHLAESSGLRKRLIESLDEKNRGQIDLWWEALFKGIYFDASDYFRHLYKTIMALSRLGGVVVVGRGANYILTLQTGFHLRVIASRQIRKQNLIKYEKLSEKQAEEELGRCDAERRQFVMSNFKQDIDDPQYYDLLLNTRYIDIEDAVVFLKQAIAAKFRKQKYLAE